MDQGVYTSKQGQSIDTEGQASLAYKHASCRTTPVCLRSCWVLYHVFSFFLPPFALIFFQAAINLRPLIWSPRPNKDDAIDLLPDLGEPNNIHTQKLRIPPCQCQECWGYFCLFSLFGNYLFIRISTIYIFSLVCSRSLSHKHDS